MDAALPCEPWPISGCPDLSGIPPSATGVGAMAATEILWAASGRQFGTCEITVRPCSRTCGPQPYGGWWWYPDRWISGWPYGPVEGGFMAAVCGQCKAACACSEAAELRLPELAQSVTEISIDGVVLPPSGYALYDGLTLVRTDGEAWPFCQDWAATSGVGVFNVKARFGRPVPVIGALAMGELIPQVLKACAGDACSLPSAVVSQITRQGVSKTFVTSSDLTGMRIGLPLADQLVGAFNPHGLTGGARIWDPEELIDARRLGGAT